MPIPDHLLPHTVTVVRPVESTDAYNNTVYDYGPAASRTVLEPGGANGGAWLQQDIRREFTHLTQQSEGRDPDEQRWMMLSNYDDIREPDHIEWAGHPAGQVTFEVWGVPEPAYTPAGYHHTESTLRILGG